MNFRIAFGIDSAWISDVAWIDADSAVAHFVQGALLVSAAPDCQDEIRWTFST